MLLKTEELVTGKPGPFCLPSPLTLCVLLAMAFRLSCYKSPIYNMRVLSTITMGHQEH